MPSICFRDCIVEHLLRYVPRASNVVIRKKMFDKCCSSIYLLIYGPAWPKSAPNEFKSVKVCAVRKMEFRNGNLIKSEMILWK